jgi:hypothetical protein
MHVEAIVATIKTRLKRFVSNWPVGLRERMQEIISSAITLDCELCQQHAYWYVRYINTDQLNHAAVVQFDDAWMKVPATYGPGQRVALMLSPALYKAGDSHGERYEQCQVAWKSEVMCFTSPVPPKPDTRSPGSFPPLVDSETAMASEQHARVVHQGGGISRAQRLLGSIHRNQGFGR